MEFIEDKPSFQTEVTPPLKPRKILFASKSTQPNHSSSESEELKSLRTAIEERDSEIEQISKSKDELQQELTRCKAKLDELIDEKDKLSGEIERMRGTMKVVESQAESGENEDGLSRRLTEQMANNQVLKQQVDSLKNTIALKDEMLGQMEGENLRASRLHSNDHSMEYKDDSRAFVQQENERLRVALAETEQELSEKMIAYEKCLLDIDDYKQTIYNLNDVLSDSKGARSVEELRVEIRTLREGNNLLKSEVSELRDRLARSERSVSPKPFSIDEITDRVEKELNYSAQLDSNILKAIESDEFNSENEAAAVGRQEEYQSLLAEVEQLRKVCQELEQSKQRLQQTLEAEREKFGSIRGQDAQCIRTMTDRLDAAMKHEQELDQLLEEERAKTAQLSTKILEFQFERSKLMSTSEVSLASSAGSSPRRMKSAEFDQETVKRLNDEIKLLKSQVDREKERGSDAEKSLAREKSRFEKELNEHKSYGEGMKEEIDRLVRENQELQDELDHTQDR